MADGRLASVVRTLSVHLVEYACLSAHHTSQTGTLSRHFSDQTTEGPSRDSNDDLSGAIATEHRHSLAPYESSESMECRGAMQQHAVEATICRLVPAPELRSDTWVRCEECAHEWVIPAAEVARNLGCLETIW